jgi:putative ubiquitin-RnfH superfamily antitoxin RatB of RatAB toxin-antitoxin module
MITIEIVYATPKIQKLISLRALPNSTIEDALIQSEFLKEFPELNLETITVGIFSKKATLHTRLKDKDRIEIYRPLLIDPMAARRKRASE